MAPPPTKNKVTMAIIRVITKSPLLKEADKKVEVMMLGIRPIVVNVSHLNK